MKRSPPAPAVMLLIVATVAGAAAAAAADNAARHASLKMRKDNGPYKDSAYSFRKATSDATVHRNYVDLVFNKCGFLHINPVSGEENRITDLGASALKDAPDAAPADARWLVSRFKPLAGHVYIEEIKQHGRTMTVKFLVDQATDDTVKLTWVTVKPLEGPDDSKRGAAGQMGQCGGPHKDDQ